MQTFFYGKLRERSPKKSEGQDATAFSDSSPTTVDDIDDDKHYYPPPPSLPSMSSTGADRGSRRAGSTRPRSARAHPTSGAVRSQVISDSDIFSSSDSSPQKTTGSLGTACGLTRARGSTRSRPVRTLGPSRAGCSGRHTAGM